MTKAKVKAIWIGVFKPKVGPNILNSCYDRYYLDNMDVPEIKGFTKTTWTGAIMNGGKPYYCPAGWMRYSLNVAKTSEEFDSKWKNWCVAYHGTAEGNFYGILTSGLRSANGCFETAKPVVYLSPSIEYSSHPRYSPVFQHKDKWFQMVLQVRVNPAIIGKHGSSTIGKRDRRIDKNISNDVIEWLAYPPSKDFRDTSHLEKPPKYFTQGGKKIEIKRGKSNIHTSEGILVYGIMLRVTDKDPKTINEMSHWW